MLRAATDPLTRRPDRVLVAGARRVLDLARDRPSLPIVRLRGRAELRHWLDGVVRPFAARS